jgi:hypothetical protein
MDQGHLEFLAGKCIVNPDLTFGVEWIPLFISTIEEGIVDLVPHLIAIHDPDVIPVPLSPVIAVDAVNAFPVIAANQKKDANAEKNKIPEFHRLGFEFSKLNHLQRHFYQ